MVDGGRAGRKVDPTYPLELSARIGARASALSHYPALASRGHGNRGNTKRWEEGTPQSPPNLVSMVEMVAWTRPQAKHWVPAKLATQSLAPEATLRGRGRTCRAGTPGLGRL